jgi:hypothetical protein
MTERTEGSYRADDLARRVGVAKGPDLSLAAGR